MTFSFEEKCHESLELWVNGIKINKIMGTDRKTVGAVGETTSECLSEDEMCFVRVPYWRL